MRSKVFMIDMSSPEESLEKGSEACSLRQLLPPTRTGVTARPAGLFNAPRAGPLA